MTERVGGIEAGGTKFVCGVGTGPDELEVSEFPTTGPEETVKRALEFFERNPVARIGIGSFGPVDLKRGFITMTPKLAWRQFDLAGAVQRGSGAEVAFDTDVNAAALGEQVWGAARGVETFLYLTIGTGIGGGGMVNGKLMHGLSHPEVGHMRIPHDWEQDPFLGVCPSHGDCLEGLASGPAIEVRWSVKGSELGAGHPAWELEAGYLALGVVNLICAVSPQRVILGGGVMKQAGLIERVGARVHELINYYMPVPEIVRPALGSRAGVLGALALALG